MAVGLGVRRLTSAATVLLKPLLPGPSAQVPPAPRPTAARNRASGRLTRRTANSRPHTAVACQENRFPDMRSGFVGPPRRRRSPQTGNSCRENDFPHMQTPGADSESASADQHSRSAGRESDFPDMDSRTGDVKPADADSIFPGVCQESHFPGSIFRPSARSAAMGRCRKPLIHSEIRRGGGVARSMPPED
jgi:hypothetical protein